MLRLHLETKFAVAGLFLAALGALATAMAQDSLVALGKVDASGTLLSSRTTVGGTVGLVDNGTGDFTVTVSSPGAFTGASPEDFVIELTIADGSLSDDDAKSSVTVSDDLLSVDVAIVDLEDDTNANGGEARDKSFYFLIRRASAGATSVSNGTRYLKAHGVVDVNGDLLSAYGLDGIDVSSVRNATGDYTVTLIKANGYSADTFDEHLIFLTPINGNNQDQVIVGEPTGVADANSVAFKVRSTDVQDGGNTNNPTAANNKFCFSIYQLDVASASGVPDSQFLTAIANIQTDGTANLALGASPSTVVNSSRVGEGDYRLTITSLGAFAGLTDDDFVVQATLRQTGTADEGCNIETTVANSDTLYVDVNTNDIEQSGNNSGVATDANFGVAVYSINPLVQPDLRIGTKKQITQQKGDDIINGTGAAQRAKLKLVDRKKKRFYFTVENVGNVVDDMRIAEVGGGKFLKTKYFDVQGGGRINVSANVRMGAEVVSNLRPAKLNRFEAQTKYRKISKRPKRKMKITGSSIHSPASADTVQAKVVVDRRG